MTTSYFSTNTQTEIIEDRYPVMMVHGLQLAEVLDRLMFERGLTDPTDVTLVLNGIDAEYKQRLSARDAEQVLLIE